VLARLHASVLALASLRACALVRLCACLRVFALAAIRAASLAFSLIAFGQFYAPVLIKICGEWGSNSRPKESETYALTSALSPPCSQSRFADVDLPGWDMPAELYLQCRGWWNELCQECNIQADPDNRKSSQKASAELARLPPVPSRTIPDLLSKG
jgi:hypothetical protein